MSLHVDRRRQVSTLNLCIEHAQLVAQDGLQLSLRVGVCERVGKRRRAAELNPNDNVARCDRRSTVPGQRGFQCLSRLSREFSDCGGIDKIIQDDGFPPNGRQRDDFSSRGVTLVLQDMEDGS